MNNNINLNDKLIKNIIIPANYKTHANILNIPILSGLKIIDTKNYNTILVAKGTSLIEQVFSDGPLANDTFEDRINKIIIETKDYMKENGVENYYNSFQYYNDYSNNTFNYKLYSQNIIITINCKKCIIKQLNAFFLEQNYKDVYQISLATAPFEFIENKDNSKSVEFENNQMFSALYENMKLILDNLKYYN